METERQKTRAVEIFYAENTTMFIWDYNSDALIYTPSLHRHGKKTISLNLRSRARRNMYQSENKMEILLVEILSAAESINKLLTHRSLKLVGKEDISRIYLS